MEPKERARRYRARQRGEDVPKIRPGPKLGYKQTAEHIEKRFGPNHLRKGGRFFMNRLRYPWVYWREGERSGRVFWPLPVKWLRFLVRRRCT